jgi:predicted P-loop ATPase
MSRIPQAFVDEVLARVDVVEVVNARVPLKRSGAEFEACCPFHDEKSPSFKVNPVKQFYHCFGCGAHGSALSFLIEHDGLPFRDALGELARSVGMVVPGDEDAVPAPAAVRAPVAQREPRERPAEKRPSWVPVLPAPDDAPEIPRAHVKRGPWSRVACYRDARGRVNGYVCRFVTSSGGKDDIPLVWARHETSGREEWRWLSMPVPRPLYALDQLAARPDDAVLLVEGEKCADAATAELPELVVSTWAGGCGAVDKADLMPLAGRTVILFPDTDSKRVRTTPAEIEAGVDPASKPFLPAEEQPGLKAMLWAAARLFEMGCRVWLVTTREPGAKPDGWDVADLIDEGVRGPALSAWIRERASRWFPAAPEGAVPAPAVEGGKGASTPPPAGAGGGDDGGGGDDAKRPAWLRDLIWDRRGHHFADCRENVFLILSRHPEWSKCVAWNEFSQRVEKRAATPTGGDVGEWTSTDDHDLGLWLAQRCDLLIRGEGTLTSGVQMTAEKRKFHPVREWLEALPAWDGIERVDHWLCDCLGVREGDYSRMVGRWSLIALVARVMQPGCTAQYMLVLEGPQGRGKSTALRILGGDWFVETPFHIGDKDAYMNLQGAWLYEFSELDALNRAETTAVKAFVSAQVDRFREPYARRPVDRPRQVVFFGTTNGNEYLKDATGNRRFWPVAVGHSIDLDKLSAWRSQLFAEALALFRAGERWHPSREEESAYIRPEQEAREIVDPWLFPLMYWLDDPQQKSVNEFTTFELLRDALKVPTDRMDGNRSMATRVGVLMSKLGWQKKRHSSGRREWYYARPAKERLRQPEVEDELVDF